MSSAPTPTIRHLGLAAYEPVWRDMQRFTDTRTAATADEIWFVEHPSVFTLGQTGRREHLLAPGDIPVIPVDRGGQVTYHGPGQWVVYPLLDLRRLGYGVRSLVDRLERAIRDVLAGYGIDATTRPGAPGVYVEPNKIASLGLRLRRGCSFHGLALNVDMDLAPFSRINPCGYEGLAMTQLRDHIGAPVAMADVAQQLEAALLRRLYD